MKKILIAAVLILLITNLVFIKTDFDDKIYFNISSFVRDIKFKNNLKIIRENLASQNKLLKINIKEDFLNKLKKTRDQCLKVGYIGNDIPNPYYPAEILWNNETYNVKLRFKGDFLDHIKDENKWSLKIKVLDGKTIFGMQEFAIQRPETRRGFGEFVFHKMLKYNGLLSIPYDFIWINHNGEEHGVYAIEGRFKNNFFKINKVDRQPIIRINDELYFEAKRKLGKARRGLHKEDWSSYSALIDAYELKKILKDSTLKVNFEIAVSKLEYLRLGKLSPSEVFNLDKLAKFYVISDLFSAYHAQQFPNLRFYFNKSDSLLEPIGFDADGLTSRKIFFGEELSFSNDKLYNGRRYEHRLNFLLEDEDFVLLYHKYLEKFSTEKFIKIMEDSLENDFRTRNKLPELMFYNHTFLRENQRYIKSKLYPPVGIHAFFKSKSNDSIVLNLSNPNFLPTEIISIQQYGKIIGKPVFNEWISAREYNKIASFKTAKFILNENYNSDYKIYIEYKVPGVDSIYLDLINNWDNQIDLNILDKN